MSYVSSTASVQLPIPGLWGAQVPCDGSDFPHQPPPFPFLFPRSPPRLGWSTLSAFSTTSFLPLPLPEQTEDEGMRSKGEGRGERRRGRAVQTGGARHPGFSPASGDSEWEAEGRPLRELRWGVQLGISQGRKTCRPWDLRAPHSGQPPSRPQHFRESPPKGRGETGAVATAPGPGHKRRGRGGRGAGRAGGAPPSLSQLPAAPSGGGARAQTRGRAF